MLVKRTSLFTGKVHEREIDISPELLDRVNSRGGGLIQDIVPHLSADDREFVLTGATPEEWDAAFKEDD